MMDVFVEKDFAGQKVKIFVREQRGHQDAFYSVNEDGGLTGTTVDRNSPEIQPIKPFLELPYMFFKHLVKAMVEQTDKEGLKTENESKLEGKLEATSLHLKDMQDIAKQLLEKVTKS